jgi:glycosyltransferase involved in cell wall biosynthesis
MGGNSSTSDARVDERLNVVTMVDGLYGGAEELAWQIAARLDPSRFSSTVCVTRWNRNPSPQDEEIVSALRTAGVAFIGVDRQSRLALAPWRSLVREMRERRIDVLHTHKFHSNFWGALIAPRVPVRVFVAHEHTWSWEGNLTRRLLDRYLVARRADIVVAVSEADRRRMTSVEGISPEKTRLIANGIPARPSGDRRADVRSTLGLLPDQPVVGMVANLRPQKAYDVLIRAAALLRDAIPDVKLLIVGSDDDAGTQMPPLAELVSALHLGEVVTFLGKRDDVFDVIDAFDVAVLSSDYEGSPLAVMEYMEAGKVVVATRVGGVPDLVIDGVTGVLIEPRDPESLAGAILNLLKDPVRARAMGEAGRERRLREFSIEATTERVEALYEELYAASDGASARRNESQVDDA